MQEMDDWLDKTEADEMSYMSDDPDMTDSLAVEDLKRKLGDKEKTIRSLRNQVRDQPTPQGD